MESEPQKFRIALVGACPYPVPQGSQVFLRDNGLALKSRGHDVHVVVYGYGLGRDLSGLRIHRARNIPWARVTAAGPTFAKPFQDLLLLGTLRHVVREHRIQAVIAHNYEALVVSLLAGCRPLIYHAHNAMSDELPYYFRYQRGPEYIGRWLDRTFPRRANRVIVPHRRLAGHLIVRGCDHTKVAIVPPPLDAGQFSPSPIEADVLPPVLYTGNLDTYQNMGLLYAAMTRLRRDEPDAKLIIATADDAEIPEAEVIPTRGFDALAKTFARDAIVAAPRVSWSGYPIKLLNAMAAGKAIVACESAAYPLTHEYDGIVVPDNDVEAFAQALLRLMRDPKRRAELGKNARQTVLTKYRPALVAEQLEQIVADAINPLGR